MTKAAKTVVTRRDETIMKAAKTVVTRLKAMVKAAKTTVMGPGTITKLETMVVMVAVC